MIYGLKTWWNAAGRHTLPVSLRGPRPAHHRWRCRHRHRRTVSPAGDPVAAEDRAAGHAGGRRGSRSPRAGQRCALARLGASGRVRAPGHRAGVRVARGIRPDQEAFAGISWTAVAFSSAGTRPGGRDDSLLRPPPETHRCSTGISMGRLCLRNAARNPPRSAMTAGLCRGRRFSGGSIASGHAIRPWNSRIAIRATEASCWSPKAARRSCSISTPATGRSQLGITEAQPTFAKLRFAAFRMQPGENASCLNLYQTTLPTILALPDPLIREFANDGRFKFIGLSPAEGWNRLLEARLMARRPFSRHEHPAIQPAQRARRHRRPR